MNFKHYFTNKLRRHRKEQTYVLHDGNFYISGTPTVTEFIYINKLLYCTVSVKDLFILYEKSHYDLRKYGIFPMGQSEYGSRCVDFLSQTKSFRVLCSADINSMLVGEIMTCNFL